MLESWVRGGGILIVTGDSGSRQGESGNLAANSALSLGPLTGVDIWSKAPESKDRNLGQGRVRFIRENIGLKYWSADANGRTAELPEISSEMSNILTAAHKSVALESSDAPATVGLTLYADKNAGELFVDVNNVNVTIAADKKSAAVIPTPTINVSVDKPNWWNASQDKAVSAYAISPGGPVTLPSPVIHGDRIDLQIPPIDYYASIVLTSKPLYSPDHLPQALVR